MAYLFCCDILGNNMSSGRAVVGKAAEGNSSSKNSALSVFSPDINTRENNEQAGHFSFSYTKLLSFNQKSEVFNHCILFFLTLFKYNKIL